jgi:hypothetical protein
MSAAALGPAAVDARPDAIDGEHLGLIDVSTLSDAERAETNGEMRAPALATDVIDAELPEICDFQRATLDVLERAAIAGHRRCEAAGRDIVRWAIYTGQALIYVNDHIPYGGWLKWLDAQPYSRRSAYNYVKLASAPELQRAAILREDSLRAALRLLAATHDPAVEATPPLQPDNLAGHDPETGKPLPRFVDYRCPRCYFGWSGRPKPPLPAAVEAATSKVSRLHYGRRPADTD